MANNGTRYIRFPLPHTIGNTLLNNFGINLFALSEKVTMTNRKSAELFVVHSSADILSTILMQI